MSHRRFLKGLAGIVGLIGAAELLASPKSASAETDVVSIDGKLDVAGEIRVNGVVAIDSSGVATSVKQSYYAP